MPHLKESPAHPGLVILFSSQLVLQANDKEYDIDVAFADTKSNGKL